MKFSAHHSRLHRVYLRCSMLALLGLGAAAAPLARADLLPDSPPAPAAASPPSGDYEVTTAVVNSTCGDKRLAPAPIKATLYTKAMKKGLVANLPLPVLPLPVSKSAVIERSDQQLTVGEKTITKLTPDRQCQSYKLTRTIEVLEVTAARIKIRHTEEYGDAASCAKPPLLSKCTFAVEQVFTLQKAK